MRNTQTNQLEAISEDGKKPFFLGREGKNFEFSDIYPIRVDFAPSSAQQFEELEKLNKWLLSVA